MPIALYVPGATSEQLARGVAAAAAAFAAEGVPAELAGLCKEKWCTWLEIKERCDRVGSGWPSPPGPIVERGARAFDLAEQAAREACGIRRETPGVTFDYVGPRYVEVWAPDASAEALIRAAEAAIAVFVRERCDPPAAALAQFERGVYDRRGFTGPEPSKDWARAACVWDEAEAAALDVCGHPPGGYLHVRTPPESARFWKAVAEQSRVLSFRDDNETAHVGTGDDVADGG